MKRNKIPYNLRSYRPITLLPVLGKLTEKIIKIKIITHLEHIKFFDHSQYGIREGRGTSSTLISLKKNIDILLKNNKYVAMVSLDIQGAFDNISWTILYKIIDETPIPIYLKSILKLYLFQRHIGTSLNQTFTWYVSKKGCPQDSCLGPLLLLFVADKILKKYKSYGGYIISYANNFVILVEGNTRSSLEQAAYTRA